MAHWATKPLPRHWLWMIMNVIQESIRCNRHLLTRPITHKPRMRWERVFCIRANVRLQIKTDLPMYDLCVKFWWKLNPFIPLTSTQVSVHVCFFYIYIKRIYIGWKRNTRCISYFTSASGNWHSGGLDCSKISAIRTHDLVCEWNRKLDTCLWVVKRLLSYRGQPWWWHKTKGQGNSLSKKVSRFTLMFTKQSKTNESIVKILHFNSRWEYAWI